MIIYISLDIIQSIVADKIIMSLDGLNLHVAQYDYGCAVFIAEVKLAHAIICGAVPIHCNHVYLVVAVIFGFLDIMQEMFTC